LTGLEPFVVPPAVPLVAGPSAMATVLLLMARQPDQWPNWLPAIFGAWFASGVILYLSSALGQILSKRGTSALQRLFGVLLTTEAVQMFLTGVQQFFASI
jgi:multiple antibiotic resistance protein